VKTLLLRPPLLRAVALRSFAVTGIAVSILITAACSQDTGTTAPVAAPSASAPGGVSADTLANTAQVCAELTTAKNAFTASFAKAATDEAKLVKVLKVGLTDLVAALNKQAANAKDPVLAEAMAQTAVAGKAMADAPDPTKAGDTAFSAAGDKLDKLCAAPGAAGGPTKAGAGTS
jgi:hypothetical protein